MTDIYLKSLVEKIEDNKFNKVKNDLERIIEEQKLEIENLKAEVKYERELRIAGYKYHNQED
jgi:hypothetical protein